MSTHHDGVADTADFTRLASGIADRDLSGFFEAWLYGEKTPPMPGHPDWRSEKPVEKPAAKPAAKPAEKPAAKPAKPTR